MQVEHPTGEIITSVYDPDGHRVAQDDGVATQQFVYDGNNLLQERDDGGTVEADYTYVPQEYARYVSQQRDAESRFYHVSGIQDVTQLTDAGETVTDDYRFDAWGKPLATTGSTENPHTYKGEAGYQSAPQLSAEESTYYLHHRVLPSQGRFLSEDPLDDDANAYRYVRNNPVNAVDPSGLEEVSQRWWPHRRTRLEEGTEIVPVPIPADATNPETSRPAPATNPQDFSLYPDLNELEKTSDFYGRHAPTAQPIPADFAPDHPADAPIHIDTTGESPQSGGLSVPGLAPEDVPRYLALVVEGYNLRKEMKAIESHLWDIPPAQTASRIKEIASLQDRLYNLNKEYRRVHLAFEESGFGNLTTTGEEPRGYDEGTKKRGGISLAGAIDAYELARSRPGPGGLEPSIDPIDIATFGAAGLRMAVRRATARATAARSAAQGTATTAPKRVFTSVDRHVAETANKLDDIFPGRVIDVNHSLPANVAGGTREVDILMDQFIIQVKRNRATGLARQVKETQATIVDQGKRVIGYAPDKYSGQAWTAAANEGIPIARNFDELVAIIKELSR